MVLTASSLSWAASRGASTGRLCVSGSGSQCTSSTLGTRIEASSTVWSMSTVISTHVEASLALVQLPDRGPGVLWRSRSFLALCFFQYSACLTAFGRPTRPKFSSSTGLPRRFCGWLMGLPASASALRISSSCYLRARSPWVCLMSLSQ